MNALLLATALLAGIVESAGEVTASTSAPAARFSSRPEGAMRPVGENGLGHIMYAGSLMLRGGEDNQAVDDNDCRGNCLVVEGECKNDKKCSPVRCPNFPVCGNEPPQAILDCHKGRCWDCSTLFSGSLIFAEASSADAPCPMCSEPAPLRVQMHYSQGCQSQHKICVSCFKKPKDVLDSAKEPLPQVPPTGRKVFLGEGAVSYERGTPETPRRRGWPPMLAHLLALPPNNPHGKTKIDQSQT